ncbi:MAG: hypothetical protein HDR17_07065 [Lachnospiraceae bacterium]|nr:hypothetical protein [Lachnospiraceae bacterium]
MRKRCWKTVLSAILASAMLFTSVPTNLTMTVHAEELGMEDMLDDVNETEVEDEQENEALTGNEAGEEENVQNPVGGGINVVTTTEDDGAETKAPDTNDGNVGSNDNQNVAKATDETGEKVDGKSVTFTCVETEVSFSVWNDAEHSSTPIYPSEENPIMVTGGRTGEAWKTLATLTKGEGDVWSATVTLSPGKYGYKFIVGENGYEAGDDRSFSIDGMNDTTISVVRGEETALASSIDGVNVEYSLTSETEAANSSGVIKLEGSAGSQKITVGADWDVSKAFTMTATQVSGSETCTVTVRVTASALVEDENGRLPLIDSEKGEVTFYYFAPSADNVTIKGQMTGSDWPSEDMALDSTTGYWEKTFSMGPGSYEYGFEVNGAWAVDPKQLHKTDVGSNNIVIVPGLVNSQVATDAVPGGDAVNLPKTLKLFEAYTDESKVNVAAAVKSKDVAVTYSVPADATSWADKVTLTQAAGEDSATVAVKSDFPTDVKSFDLVATDETGTYTSKVTVNVVSTLYTYTIYYYDAMHEMSTEAVDLWVWENGGGGGNIAVPFTEKEELEDGREWLKATTELSFTSLGMKSRAKGTWDEWQDGVDRTYNNKEAKEEVTLYYVFGQPLTDTLPEIKEGADRYLVVEYTRETKKDGNWQLRTWNNGFGTTVCDFVAEEDGTFITQVPVAPGVDSISYNIRRTEPGNEWAEKDGNDYNCPMPVDQNIVKIKMEEGKGITYTYPYNTGYEIDTKEKKINFYYRDDDAFLAGSEGGYADVSLEVIAPKADSDAKAADGEEEISKQTAKMIYDEEEQRYEYVLDQLVSGDHYYRYGRKETTDDNVEYVLDAFNELKETVAETEYSVLKYELLDVEMVAEIQNATMDYNDNNVLSIKVKAKDLAGNQIEETSDFKVVERATVDLDEVGGGITDIDPELLAISIAVKQGTSAGEKTLPITIYDVYNNEYTTEAKVTVVDRSKDSDFDWDEAVVYFAVTDRFFDGNAANNEGDAPGSYDKTTNGGLNSSYHGGDFAGLTQKLDYLQELGVNTIWITPIVENQAVANSVDDPTVKEAWGYTGYWAKDFTKLDSHLGTEAEFSALLNAAHAKGMKVMVDVVLNHTGYGKEITDYYNAYVKNEGDDPIRMLRNSDEVVPGSDQMSSLSGLPDFRTEDPEVRELVVEWQSNWISKYPIDYYRVDTVKHVDDTTWSAFKNALTEINPDFKMIGEWAGAGYTTDTGMLNTGRMDALLDFDFPAKAADFVTGDLSGVEGFLSARNGAIDNTASLGSWLSNHDQQGFVKRLMSEKGIQSEEEAKQLALVAASLQLTAKGQVYIYYGEEIGVSDGEENYPYQSNRRDFDWSKVTDDNEALAHYKKMISIRNMYSELFAKGARNTVSTDNGLDVFTRSYGGTTLTVALNITNQAQNYTLSGQTPGKVLLDYYSGSLFPIDENGNAVITVPAAADGGTVVLVQDEELENHPEGMQIRKIPDQTYTGLSIKLPEDVLQVYAGTNKLKAGVDYTVSYKNNKAIGTATVTIKGKGNYKDSVTAQFNIVPKDIAADDVVITYNEYVKASTKEQKPLSKITYNGKKLTTKEYQVAYYKLDTNGRKTGEALNGVQELGNYAMEITATGKNYTGVAKKTIHVVEGKFMNELKITFGSTSVTYAKTSEELETKLGVVVKDGDVELEKGKDYEVRFPDGIEVGNAKIAITAINKETNQKYYGSVTKTFKIKGEPLNSVAKVNPTGWVNVAIDPVSGKAEQLPGVAVLVKKNNNSPELTLDDYTVSYSNNTKPGTATVIFTGKGKYTGTLKKTFKVTAIAWKAADLGNDLKVTVSETAPFSKKGAQPAVTVTYMGKKLAAGKDYKVTYNNNKTLTTGTKKPSVNIAGMGMFSGTIKNAAEFTIVRANLETAGITVTAPDVELASGYESKPVVKAADGTYLIKDTDYEVTYHKLDENGEPKDIEAGFEPSPTTRMQVTVTGKGNYEGSVPKEYRIVGTSISKATIIVKAQTYTGKAITLGGDDFSKARIGKQPLTYGTDYVIVADSYEKNVNKGNATVTVKGIGNYGGEKKITFRITSAGMRWWWNLFS